MSTKVGRFLHDLQLALARVSTEYKDMGTLRGEQAYDVHVEIVGLTRPENEVFFAAVEKRTLVSQTRKLDPELAAARTCTLDVTVVGLNSIAAAGTLVLDVIRADLAECGFTGKVESICLTVGEAWKGHSCEHRGGESCPTPGDCEASCAHRPDGD